MKKVNGKVNGKVADLVETRAYIERKMKQKSAHISREIERLRCLRRMYEECGGVNLFDLAYIV